MIWIKKCEGKKIAAVNQVFAVNQVYISFKNVDKTGNCTEKDFVNDQILDKQLDSNGVTATQSIKGTYLKTVLNDFILGELAGYPSSARQ